MSIPPGTAPPRNGVVTADRVDAGAVEIHVGAHQELKPSSPPGHPRRLIRGGHGGHKIRSYGGQGERRNFGFGADQQAATIEVLVYPPY